jgi:hypothetical protein
MLGGTMTAHPWHGDGFKVSATLPVSPPADATDTAPYTGKTTAKITAETTHKATDPEDDTA